MYGNSITIFLFLNSLVAPPINVMVEKMEIDEETFFQYMKSQSAFFFLEKKLLNENIIELLICHLFLEFSYFGSQIGYRSSCLKIQYKQAFTGI